MAKPIHAIAKYGPKIKQGNTVHMERLVDYVAGRTGLSTGAVMIVLMELRDSLLFFNREGQAVKLDGLGTFTPKIGLDGEIRVSHRADNWLKRNLNLKGKKKFNGEILNKNMIGKTVDDLIARWNQDHQDDPVVKPSAG